MRGETVGKSPETAARSFAAPYRPHVAAPAPFGIVRSRWFLLVRAARTVGGMLAVAERTALARLLLQTCEHVGLARTLDLRPQLDDLVAQMSGLFEVHAPGCGRHLVLHGGYDAEDLLARKLGQLTVDILRAHACSALGHVADDVVDGLTSLDRKSVV